MIAANTFALSMVTLWSVKELIALSQSKVMYTFAQNRTKDIKSFVFCSKFIQKKYKMDPDDSAYIAGAVYDVSMVLSPFLGGIIVSIFGASGC
jgi:hypothetical protein